MTGDKDGGVAVPSEMGRQRKWDWAVSEFGKKAGVGALACGVASMVLFGRGSGLRLALTSFGAGFGGGWAWKVVADEFAKK